MFEMRTDSRSTSVRSPLVTRPHHSNLYGRIERFVRFLREGDVHLGSALFVWLIARGWLRVVDSACRLRSTSLGNTGDVRVMLGVPPKFLVVLRACPGPTGPANVAPGLRHRHNGPGSPGPLIEPLEGHPELPMLLNKSILLEFIES